MVLIAVATGNLLAVEKHTGIWGSFNIIGPISRQCDPAWKYYFDSQLELIDNPYKFEEFYSSAGFGKQITDRFTLFLINRIGVRKSINSGDTKYEYRLIEQAGWTAFKNDTFTIVSRTRIEERKEFDEPGISLRFRERIAFNKPLISWPEHAFVLYDEVFLNLNRPVWVTDRLFVQNLVFIGINTRISKSMTYDLGYLNQYTYSNPGSPNRLINILYIRLYITNN